MKYVMRVVFGIGLAATTYGPAFAAPVTFTWDPSAIGLPNATSQIVASNFNVADFADVNITSSGAFTENSALTVLGFLNGGVPDTPGGFLAAGGYNFYVTFSGAGTQGAIPALNSNLATTGSFASGSYTFWASPNQNTTATLNPGGSPTIGNNNNAFALFGGQLVNGTVTLTAPSGGGYSPKADINLTVDACTASGQVLASGVTCGNDESAFFVDPLPADLDLLFGDFSANTQIVTLGAGADGSTNLDINGGGGNLTLSTVPVPEPASMLILSSGLMGLALLGRRRARG